MQVWGIWHESSNALQLVYHRHGDWNSLGCDVHVSPVGPNSPPPFPCCPQIGEQPSLGTAGNLQVTMVRQTAATRGSLEGQWSLGTICACFRLVVAHGIQPQHLFVS